MRYPFRVMTLESKSDLVTELQAELVHDQTGQGSAAIGLVVIDITGCEGSTGSLARGELEVLRQVAREAHVALVVLEPLPPVDFPVQVSESLLDQEDVGGEVFSWQAEPWWHHFDVVIPGAPEGVEDVADVLMLLQWSVDGVTGMEFSDRRILQVLRRRDSSHCLIHLHHNPSTGEYIEDEEHQYLTSFGSSVLGSEG